MKVVSAYLLSVLGGNSSPQASDIKSILDSGALKLHCLCTLPIPSSLSPPFPLFYLAAFAFSLPSGILFDERRRSRPTTLAFRLLQLVPR